MKNQTVCDSKAIYGKQDAHSHGGGGMMNMSGGKGDSGAPQSTGVGSGKDYEGIVQMTVCDKPIKVSKGDIYTIESTIDFQEHPA
jgi:hypothetical protein